MKPLLITLMLILLVACNPLSPQQPPTSPSTPPTPDVSTQQDQVEQPVEQKTGPQQMIPQQESIVPEPVMPVIEESDPTARPEPIPSDSKDDVSEELAKQEEAMESGAHILNTEGESIIRDLTCDLSTNLITFNLVNELENSYSIRKESVFSLPDGVYPMRFSINGREIRTIDEQCGGVAFLKPGDSVPCSIEFAPNSMKDRVMVRVGPDEFGNPLTNTIHFASAYDQSQVLFVCRE